MWRIAPPFAAASSASVMGASLAPKSTCPALMRATPAPEPTLSYFTWAPCVCSNSFDQNVMRGATNVDPAPVICPAAGSSLAIPTGAGRVSSPVPQTGVGSPWIWPGFAEVTSVLTALFVSLPRAPATAAASTRTMAMDERLMSASSPKERSPAWRWCLQLRFLVAVAEAPDRGDPGRGRGVLLDLGPEALDVDVEGLRVADVARPPHPVHQGVAGEDPAGVDQQQLEEVELLEGQLDGLAPHRHLVADGVEADVGHLDDLGGGVLLLAGGPAEGGPDAGHQLPEAERLGHVVVGAHLEADDGVDLGVAGRQHDDRHPRLGPQLPADVDARHAGQHDVEQHQRRPVRLEPVDRLQAVGRHLHEEPLAPQRHGQGVAVALLVVDDENGGRLSHRLKTSGLVGRCGWRQPAAA